MNVPPFKLQKALLDQIMTIMDQGWLGDEAMNLFVCLLNNFFYTGCPREKKIPKVFALYTHSIQVLVSEREWYVQDDAEALKFYKEDEREVANKSLRWYALEYKGTLQRLLDLFCNDGYDSLKYIIYPLNLGGHH